MLRAVVTRHEFHGHDTVITLDPRLAAVTGPLIVRADGDLDVADGTEVEVTADGSALAWPATRPRLTPGTDAGPSARSDARRRPPRPT